jgi:broad specificity phosphatase PhoE
MSAMDEAGSTTEPAFAVSTTEAAFAVGEPLVDGAQIWLIRHGETAWSKSGQHTGRTDIALTPHGEEQAGALRERLGKLSPALVLSSPRQRALRTAELAGVTVDAIDPDLAEWDYGDYEGLTTAQIRKSVPDWSLWTHGVPGGETAVEVGRRADRVLSAAAAEVANGPVLLFAHGHISRVLGARWIGLATVDGGRFALGTAAPSVLGSEHQAPVIERGARRRCKHEIEHDQGAGHDGSAVADPPGLKAQAVADG